MSKEIEALKTAALAVLLNVRPLKEDGFSVIENHRIKSLGDALRDMNNGIEGGKP